MACDRAGYERTEYMGEENSMDDIRTSVITRTVENKV